MDVQCNFERSVCLSGNSRIFSELMDLGAKHSATVIYRSVGSSPARDRREAIGFSLRRYRPVIQNHGLTCRPPSHVIRRNQAIGPADVLSDAEIEIMVWYLSGEVSRGIPK